MSIVIDEEAFTDRLSSFRVESWFAKPAELSPAVCASFGWSNVGPNKLQCQSCQARLQYTPSANFLEAESMDVVNGFLQSLEWEHDADCVWCEEQCPVEFRRIQTEPPDRALHELTTRFARFNTLWDLPKLDCSSSLEATVEEKMRKLQELLHGELRQSVPSDLDVMLEEWPERSHTLTVMALMGWELRVMDYPLGLDLASQSDSMAKMMQSGTALRPEESGCCVARQCVIECPRCTASVGLWSCPTTAEMSLSDFQESSKARIQTGLQIVVDVETGEVEDLFRRTYDAADIDKNVTVSMKAPESQEEAEGTLKRSLSLDRESVGARPVFGLQCLKKKRVSTDSKAVESSPLFLKEVVSSGQLLDPIEEHRPFCVYRTQWRAILEALTQLKNAS